jgi:hypothetical protein
MKSDGPASVYQSSRRLFLRNALLVGAGVSAIGMTSTSLAGSAQADSASLEAPDSSVPLQWSWAWCSKCQGLYYGPIGGDCPADQEPHGLAKSYDYGLYYDGSGTDWQQGWRYCAYCAGLFYSPEGIDNGVCPSGLGAFSHRDMGTSYLYIVFHDSGTYDNAQAGWRWCLQCQGMFYCPSGTHAGVCPVDNGIYSHNCSGSYPYQMIDAP